MFAVCGWVSVSVRWVCLSVCEVGGCVCEYLTVDVSIAYRCRFVLADYNMSCDDVRVVLTFLSLLLLTQLVMAAAFSSFSAMTLLVGSSDP